MAYIDAAAEGNPLWEITYWCANCDSFYGHSSLVEPPEPLLLHLERADPRYTHCGRPMKRPPSQAGNRTGHEEASILLCDCGFTFHPPTASTAPRNPRPPDADIASAINPPQQDSQGWTAQSPRATERNAHRDALVERPSPTVQ